MKLIQSIITVLLMKSARCVSLAAIFSVLVTSNVIAAPEPSADRLVEYQREQNTKTVSGAAERNHIALEISEPKASLRHNSQPSSASLEERCTAEIKSCLALPTVSQIDCMQESLSADTSTPRCNTSNIFSAVQARAQVAKQISAKSGPGNFVAGSTEQTATARCVARFDIALSESILNGGSQEAAHALLNNITHCQALQTP